MIRTTNMTETVTNPDKLISTRAIVDTHHVLGLVSFRKEEITTILPKRITLADVSREIGTLITRIPRSGCLGYCIYVPAPVDRDQMVTRSYLDLVSNVFGGVRDDSLPTLRSRQCCDYPEPTLL
jgi:hypothetical protein